MGWEGKGRGERRSYTMHKYSDKMWIDLFGRKYIGNIKLWDVIGWNNLKNVNSECEVYEGLSISLSFVLSLKTFSTTK